MKHHHVYVDTRTLLRDGQLVSAVEKGRAVSSLAADLDAVADNSYRIDFHKLVRMLNAIQLCKSTLHLFGVDLDSTTLAWHNARAAGFHVHLAPALGPVESGKILAGRMVSQIVRDACKAPKPEDHPITIVTGDSGFEPVVRTLAQDGYDVKVAYWAHASRHLVAACPKFIPMNRMVRMLELPGTGMLFR